MNYKTLKENLDKATGENAALRSESAEMRKLVLLAQKTSRQSAHKCGLAEGRLEQITRSLR